MPDLRRVLCEAMQTWDVQAGTQAFAHGVLMSHVAASTTMRARLAVEDRTDGRVDER